LPDPEPDAAEGDKDREDGEEGGAHRIVVEM
jgi:hypothetical protein